MSTPLGPKPASLMPREHGAYAEVAFPLITAVALGATGGASLLLASAVVAAFLAHEPVTVLTGGRGGRALQESGARALRRAMILSGLGLAAGAAGLWLAPAPARLAALLPAGLGALLIPLILTRREKTIVGELIVALTFSSALIPVALAGGVGLRAAVVAAGVWAAVFSLSTVTVQAVIAGGKKKGRSSWSAVAPTVSAAVIAAALVLAAKALIPTLAALAVIPSALVALAFGLLRVHPRHLRTLGWSLVASNVVALAILLIALGRLFSGTATTSL